MEIIILAGGLGTRLSHIIKDIPKPMAPINNIPFLIYIFEQILKYDVKKIILATGYKSEIIENYFGKSYKGIPIVYSIETEPLGTGGAIKKALSFCDKNEEDVCVLNGDTYFCINLNELFSFHKKNNSLVTLGIKRMNDFDRYGTIQFENDTIIKFNEKKKTDAGFINAGVYIIKKSIFCNIKQTKFSFEKDYLEKFVSKGHFKFFESKGYFIDIGVPGDYKKANEMLKL